MRARDDRSGTWLGTSSEAQVFVWVFNIHRTVASASIWMRSLSADSRLSSAAGLGAHLSGAEQRRRAEANLQSGGTAFDAEVAGTQRLAVQIDIELAVALEFDP